MGKITTNGRIISTDGSRYIPPSQSTDITNEEFIPYEFAKTKFDTVVNDFKTSVEKYKAYISELETKQKEQLKGFKLHYETIIIDLKGKAKRHIGNSKIFMGSIYIYNYL